jgi:hypothetical protein
LCGSTLRGLAHSPFRACVRARTCRKRDRAAPKGRLTYARDDEKESKNEDEMEAACARCQESDLQLGNFIPGVVPLLLILLHFCSSLSLTHSLYLSLSLSPFCIGALT